MPTAIYCGLGEIPLDVYRSEVPRSQITRNQNASAFDNTTSSFKYRAPPPNNLASHVKDLGWNWDLMKQMYIPTAAPAGYEMPPPDLSPRRFSCISPLQPHVLPVIPAGFRSRRSHQNLMASENLTCVIAEQRQFREDMVWKPPPKTVPPRSLQKHMCKVWACKDRRPGSPPDAETGLQCNQVFRQSKKTSSKSWLTQTSRLANGAERQIRNLTGRNPERYEVRAPYA